MREETKYLLFYTACTKLYEQLFNQVPVLSTKSKKHQKQQDVRDEINSPNSPDSLDKKVDPFIASPENSLDKSPSARGQSSPDKNSFDEKLPQKRPKSNEDLQLRKTASMENAIKFCNSNIDSRPTIQVKYTKGTANTQNKSKEEITYELKKIRRVFCVRSLAPDSAEKVRIDAEDRTRVPKSTS